MSRRVCACGALLDDEREPLNDDEWQDAIWQDAVNIAEALLLFVSAQQYGLITGSPSVNVTRCEEILRRGRARGVLPRRARVDKIVDAVVRGGGGRLGHQDGCALHRAHVPECAACVEWRRAPR